MRAWWAPGLNSERSLRLASGGDPDRPAGIALGMKRGGAVILESFAEPRLELSVVTALHRHFSRIDILPRLDDIGKILRIAVEVCDHVRLHPDVFKTRLQHHAAPPRPALDIHAEMLPDP